MLWFLWAQTLRDCSWTKQDKIASNMSKETLDHALKMKHKFFVYQCLSASQRVFSKKMRHGAKGSDFYFWCIVKIPCLLNYLKGNGILILQNDTPYFTHISFESNPPSTVNTAKFDCLDLSGPGCMLMIAYESYCRTFECC